MPAGASLRPQSVALVLLVLLIPADDHWLQLTVLNIDPGELQPLDINLVETIAKSTRLKTVLETASN